MYHYPNVELWESVLQQDIFLLTAFLGAFAKLQKVTVLLCSFIYLSAWNNWAPTGRILMKLDVWRLVEEIQV